MQQQKQSRGTGVQAWQRSFQPLSPPACLWVMERPRIPASKLMHEGSVAAFSDEPGSGSRFLVRLRINHVESRPVPKTGPARSHVAARILVVDDNVDAAISMAKLLESCGPTVRVAHDGEEALNAAIADTPDAVVLDIGLPGMDGYEVARAAPAQSTRNSVRLIALSGFGRDEDKQRSRAAGFDVPLTKRRRVGSPCKRQSQAAARIEVLGSSERENLD